MTSPPQMTTIKVPVSTRDELRRRAKEAGMTQAEFLERAVADVAMHDFQRDMARWEPDEEYLAEMHEWDQADLASPLQHHAATA